MEANFDFLKYLEMDVGVNILMRLDKPADLVRASAVSHYWRHFVITNGLVKHLCLTIFPQLSKSSHTIIFKSGDVNDPVKAKSSSRIGMEALEADHKAYASLLEALSKIIDTQKECLANAVRASSTDHDPDEGIDNTLCASSRSRWGSPTYWSSKGQNDVNVPETLTYRLSADLTIVTQIDIRPFQVYWDPNQPICSSKSVRFRLGHCKFQCPLLCKPDDDSLVWTYTSPVFPMHREYRLHPFTLQKPALCVGGFLQIEFLGRVQRAELDRLFYICINYVRVLGLPLKPAFDIEILKPSGEFVLKYYPESLDSIRQLSYDIYIDPLEPARMWEFAHRQQFMQLAAGAAADPQENE